MKNLLIIVFYSCLIITISAQNDLPIGGWKSYLPANTGTYITESEDYVFYVSTKSLTRFDKQTLEPKFLSTIDGLSDINVRLAVYNKTVDALLVIYENSNIDIIYQDEIINISDIKRSNSIQGDKSIYNVHMHNERAYLSAGFGILALDLNTAVILTSTETPGPVTDLTIYDGQFFALMNGEIFGLPESEFFNFQYWTLWEAVNDSLDLPQDLSHIEVFSNQLYAASDKDIWIRKNDTTTQLFSGGDRTFIPFLQKGYNYLMAGIGDYNGNDHVRFYDPTSSYLQSSPCHGILNHSIESSTGQVFYGDQYGGYRYAASPEADCNTLFFEGPFTSGARDILFKESTLAVAGGGPNRDFQYTYTTNGFYYLKNGEWTNITPGNRSELKDPMLYHFYKVDFDPDNNIYYAGTYWGGIVKYQANEDIITVLEDSTSCLEGAVGDAKRERITGLLLDDNKDLWVSNYAAPIGLKVFRQNGSCESINIPVSSTLAEMTMDPLGFLWIRVAGSDAGLLVYDQGEVSNQADDRFKVITSSNSALPNNDVTALTVSRNGNLWVGTSDGLILFACGEAVFEFNCSSQPIVDPDGDGVGDFLLDDVRINAVITDGANRVWVGTDGGIIVLSPTGSEQVMQFDIENSPLFSNVIEDFAFDEESGIMYIATNEGLMSYRTQSTIGGNFTAIDAYAYPNPVYPDFTGPIAIKGLAEDAIVKITDIKGRILFETEALGGQAIWDGRHWNGDRVASGVYLAWISERSDFTAPEGAVVKIVVIN